LRFRFQEGRKELIHMSKEEPEAKTKPLYDVRRVHIGKNAYLQELSHECGELYSRTLVFFWRTVRRKGIWLKSKHLMRLFTSPKLHAHTSDACVQAFFASLASWRERRKTDPHAKPPGKRRWYFRIEYKRSAMKLAGGVLRLSNGQGNKPLLLPWPHALPQTVVIRWTGTDYEALATYKIGDDLREEEPQDFDQRRTLRTAGIDLGEVHIAVSHDGEHSHILNGRLLRSKRQYQNKLKAKLDSKIDAKKKGSKRRKLLIRSKQKQLRKLKNQMKDVEHKQSRALISILEAEGVQRLVIGDVRDIRQELDVGPTTNQKLHQWSCGSVRHKLTYKAERVGMGGHAHCPARGKLHQQDVPHVRPSTQEESRRTRLHLHKQNMQVARASGLSGRVQHQTKVSGSRPSSWGDGSPHGYSLHSGCPRSSGCML
jgi:putative transposase